MMIKVIICDFDGVIINEFQTHYELARKQITDLTEKEFKRLFEGNVHSEIEKLKNRDTGFDMKYYFNEHKKTVLIKPKIRSIIKKLSGKYILGIISSAKESGAIECIRNSGLGGIFSFVYGLETHKLKTEKFNLVLENFSVSKGECIFVTDTLGDVFEAKKVGIETIVVDYGYHERETLLKGKPLEIISNLSELSEVLERY